VILVARYYKLAAALVGALSSYLFGGWPLLLEVLLILICIDYFTGLVAGAVEGKLSSAVGWKGIGRKICIFLLVAVAHFVDLVLGDKNLFRDAAIFFYLANELLSILENSGRIGLPIPPAIAQAVEILKGKGNMDSKTR